MKTAQVWGMVGLMAIALLGTGLSLWFLGYGIKAGLIEKRILADFAGHYDEGKKAVGRGMFYILVGLFFSWTSFMLWRMVFRK